MGSGRQIDFVTWERLRAENVRLRSDLDKAEREMTELRIAMQGVPFSVQQGIFAETYIETRIHEEIERARRYRHYFSLLMIRLLPKERMQEATDSAMGAGQFSKRVRDILRGMDLIFVMQDGRITIVLPETTKRESSHVVERLETGINGAARLVYSVASFPDDGNEESRLVAVAEDRLSRVLRASVP